MPRYGSNPAKGLEPRECVICQTRFQPYRDHQIACKDPTCREVARALSPRLIERQIVCNGCGQEFTARWSGLGSRQPKCSSCTAAAARLRQDKKNVARRVGTAADPAARRAKNLRSQLRRYGITPDEYRTILASQDGRCAICGDPPDPDGVRSASRLHVDHDHATGANRDLLCLRCNQGIGSFRDDPALLRAAAEYIERHRAGAL